MNCTLYSIRATVETISTTCVVRNDSFGVRTQPANARPPSPHRPAFRPLVLSTFFTVVAVWMMPMVDLFCR